MQTIRFITWAAVVVSLITVSPPARADIGAEKPESVVDGYLAAGKLVPRRVITKETVFTRENAAMELPNRAY